MFTRSLSRGARAARSELDPMRISLCSCLRIACRKRFDVSLKILQALLDSLKQFRGVLPPRVGRIFHLEGDACFVFQQWVEPNHSRAFGAREGAPGHAPQSVESEKSA